MRHCEVRSHIPFIHSLAAINSEKTKIFKIGMNVAKAFSHYIVLILSEVNTRVVPLTFQIDYMVYWYRIFKRNVEVFHSAKRLIMLSQNSTLGDYSVNAYQTFSNNFQANRVL